MLSLAVEVEKAVRYFPRYHKYTLGSELRGFCHEGLGLIAEANSTVNRGGILMHLRSVMERLKIHLFLAKELQAFNRARTFYRIMEMTVAVSRQNEGWLRSAAKRSQSRKKGGP